MPATFTANQLLAVLRDTLVRAEVSTGEDGTNRAELTLIGGAAGLFMGWLPPSRTTSDIDVVAATPEADWLAICEAAIAIADERGLSPTWLNDACRGLFGYEPPAGWRERRTPLGTFGHVAVFAVGLDDWIALKALAAADRDVDVSDLQHVGLTQPQAEHARAFIRSLRGSGDILASKAQMALEVVDALCESDQGGIDA
jgi:hypothetical protein